MCIYLGIYIIYRYIFPPPPHTKPSYPLTKQRVGQAALQRGHPPSLTPPHHHPPIPAKESNPLTGPSPPPPPQNSESDKLSNVIVDDGPGSNAMHIELVLKASRKIEAGEELKQMSVGGVAVCVYNIYLLYVCIYIYIKIYLHI